MACHRLLSHGRAGLYIDGDLRRECDVGIVVAEGKRNHVVAKCGRARLSCTPHPHLNQPVRRGGRGVERYIVMLARYDGPP